MRKIAHCATLAVAMAALVSAGGGLSVAQAPKTKPKDTTTAAADVGTVEFAKDAKGQMRFKVVGTDGKALVTSTKGYETKDEAMKAFDAVNAAVNKGKVVDAK